MENPSLPRLDNPKNKGESLSQGAPNITLAANTPSSLSTLAPAPAQLNIAPRGSQTENKNLIPGNAKVAIPRQRAATTRYSRRVPRACESCRQRKTKCSGDTPVCRQCKELRVSCRYPVSWRERTKGEINNLASQATDYENLLKDIGTFADGRTADRIKGMLEKYSATTGSPSASSQSQSVTPRDEDNDDAESLPSSIGSLEAIDRVEEDLNRTPDSRATGYMGKNSEVTWLQRLRKEAEQRSHNLAGTYEGPNEGEFSIHAMNYHLDDMEVSVPGPVQVYKMPPHHVADKLFEDYLTTVHPFFPIISRTLFASQYKTFFDSAARPGDKWLAILNLIFAISARHAHLIQAPWRGEPDDHLVYLTRARILSMNGDVLFSHPDLQQVQVEGLLAYYLLATDQINRAWRIEALAVRSAISLGLNMKNTSEQTSNISKEARCRVWWCLYTFEHMLGIMTGRATCIQDGICTTPCPLPFEEEQLAEPPAMKVLADGDARAELIDNAVSSAHVRHVPLNPPGGKDAKHTDKLRDTSWLRNLPPCNAMSFLYYVDLSIIVQEIVNRVYSLDCAVTPWAHIENRMGELRSRIDLWQSNLPEVYDFTRRDEQREDILRSKLFLAFHYYSARITLGRPCLCRRDAHHTAAPDKPQTFSHSMAVTTLISARMMLDLIPDTPDPLRLYQISPWWCVLHYLMQAATVLLLELSFACIHMPDHEHNIILLSKKAIRWLFAMANYGLASRRAWELCDSNFRRIAQGMNYDVSDLPTLHYAFTPGYITKEPLNTGQTSGPGPAPLLYDLIQQQQQQQQQQRHPHQHQLPQDRFPAATDQIPLSYSGAPAADGIPPNLPISPGNDAYFPYDPICGEFIRSFFPVSQDEDDWSHPQGIN